MFSWPTTSSLVPEQTSHTRLQVRITRSMSGETSLIAAVMITIGTAISVATTPARRVTIVLGMSITQRIEARVASGSYPDPVDKDEARRRSRQSGPVPGDIGSQVVAVLFSWLSTRLPGTAAAYLPMREEVDVTALFDQLPGWRWVLPRIEDDGTLTFRDRDVARETHPWGMSPTR